MSTALPSFFRRLSCLRVSFFLLDLPLNPPEAADAAEYADTIRLAAGDLKIVACAYSARTRKLLVHLDATRYVLRLEACRPLDPPCLVARFPPFPSLLFCSQELEALSPNTTALQESHTTDKIRGIMLTTKAPADSGYDFFSRCASEAMAHGVPCLFLPPVAVDLVVVCPQPLSLPHNRLCPVERHP